VDTRLIKDRLAAFDRAQQGYATAQAKVQQADAELDKAQAQFRTDQQAVVDLLARALVADGEPLRNPFAGVAAPTPAALMRLPAADAVKTLPELIAAIRRSKLRGKPTLQALPGVEKTARALEQLLARMDALRLGAREARATRDAVALTWEAELGALKRRTRAAADDGAPMLFTTLFNRPARPNGKNHKPVPVPESPPTPAPAASATPTAAPAAS
jgi:hypothetical protein